MTVAAPGPDAGPRDERGFALLLVLWTLGLLALLGTRVLGSGRTEARLAANLERAAQLEALADGTARTAMFHRLPGAAQWPADAIWRTDPQPPGTRATASVRIVPLGGRLNPNLATPDQWTGLLTALGLDTDRATTLAGLLIGWRTPGMGAGATQIYTHDNRAWGPPGSSFESLGELGLVEGMTPDLLARLLPHLSLAQPLEPDPALADPIVLRAMGGASLPSPAPADRDRAQAYLIEATATDGPARFGRRATVLIDPTDTDQPIHILQWESD